MAAANKYGDTPLSRARPKLRKKLEGVFWEGVGVQVLIVLHTTTPHASHTPHMHHAHTPHHTHIVALAAECGQSLMVQSVAGRCGQVTGLAPVDYLMFLLQPFQQERSWIVSVWQEFRGLIRTGDQLCAYEQ